MSRILYFDVDGTLLVQSTSEPKPSLAAGRFESAVRSAKFDALVCVGNFVAIAHTMHESDAQYDRLGAIFALSQGVFRDETWFRAVTRLAQDPKHRALEIDLASDWWYVDDCAREFMTFAGLADVYAQESGQRICVPAPDGDGADVMAWLERVAART